MFATLPLGEPARLSPLPRRAARPAPGSATPSGIDPPGSGPGAAR